MPRWTFYESGRDQALKIVFVRAAAAVYDLFESFAEAIVLAQHPQMSPQTIAARLAIISGDICGC